MRRILDAFIGALGSLAEHKLRTTLTMLGMMFGVGAVIAMLSIGAGAEKQALALIDKLGTRNVVIRSKTFKKEELEEIRKKSIGLSQRDVEAIQEAVPGVSFAAGQTAGLEHTAYFTAPQASYCNGTHIVEVEVDVMTGGVTLLNYTVAHDSGTIINPLIVDGQVQGGVAHGIGNALFESMRYDDNAQPLTTTFADYLLPTAPDVPGCAIEHIETPNPLNPLGVKGAGEGGTIPAPATIIAAVEDALSPFGVRFLDMPLTPERVVTALRKAGAYEKLSA